MSSNPEESITTEAVAATEPVEIPQATSETLPQETESETEPKAETVEEAAAEPKGETNEETAEVKESDAEVKEEPTFIEEGIVHKRGPLPLRLWQKRLMTINNPKSNFSLYELRIVYRKNVKKSQSPKEEFEKVNKLLFETIATATVNSNDIIVYYKPGSKDIPQGLINLKQVLSIEAAPKIKPFAFLIKTQARDYIFNTSNKKELDSWIHTLSTKLGNEIPDFSDAQGYKFSYEHLVNRKGFLPPASSPGQDDEVFSASEAEFVNEEVAPTSSAEPEQPEAQPAATATEASQPTGKSFLNEVLGIFYQKSSENDASVTKAVPEAEAKAEEPTGAQEASEPVAEATTEEVIPADNQETAQETEGEKATEANSNPTEEKVKTHKNKTFSFSGFQGGKFLSFFGKSPPKEGAKNETAVEIVEPEAVATEDAQEAEVKEEPVKDEAEAEAITEAPVTTAEGTSPETEAKAKSIPFLSRVFSLAKPKATVNETKPESTTEPKTEEAIKEETQVAADTEEIQEPTQEAEGTVDQAPEAEKQEEVVAEKSAEASEPVVEKKGNFFTRILSKRKPNGVTAAPVVEAAIVEKTEVITEENAAEEAKEVAEAEPKVEETLEEFIASEDPVAVEEVVAEVVATEPAAEEINVEPVAEITKEVSESALPETTETAAPAVEEDKRPFIVRVLSGKRKEKPAPASEPEVKEEVVEPTSSEPKEAEAAEEATEPTESTEEVKEENAEAVPAEENQEDAPARQASLIARIGDYAYSAVAPGAPSKEINEEISEHYKALIEDAVISGFLFKQSYLLHSNNHRFGILGKDGIFKYYHDAITAEEGKKIVIDESVTVEANAELSFIIKTSSQSFTFSTRTAEERDNWVNAFSQFAKKAEEANVITESSEAAVEEAPVEAPSEEPANTEEASKPAATEA